MVPLYITVTLKQCNNTCDKQCNNLMYIMCTDAIEWPTPDTAPILYSQTFTPYHTSISYMLLHMVLLLITQEICTYTVTGHCKVKCNQKESKPPTRVI